MSLTIRDLPSLIGTVRLLSMRCRTVKLKGMTNRIFKSQEPLTGFAIAGWLLYTIGSLIGASAYEPSVGQLVSAGLLMGTGLFFLDRYLSAQGARGWETVIQRLRYLSTLLLIPAFLALGLFGFQPGLVQLSCIYGGYLALVLYGLSFVLTLVNQLRKKRLIRSG